ARSLQASRARVARTGGRTGLARRRGAAGQAGGLALAARSTTPLRAGSARYDVQLLIDCLDRAVDLGIGAAELMRDQLHQEVDPLDEGRAAGDRAGRRRRLEQA